jgi:hypothetical protein
MENKLPDQPFFDTLPMFAEFEGVADAGNYRALPDEWSLATADIVDSTNAIAAGGYKSVNMAGASVISALLNALDRRDLPFVFGGDGALVAFPSSATAIVREALSAVQAWVAEELDLTMRAAIVPMGDIRARGLDVRVARFQASGEVSYAMFTGGGASWAEAEMKAGRYRIEPAPAGARPDLTGLSCRWNPIEARRGEIVSIIAVPGAAGSGTAFQQLVADIVALAGEQERDGHPVSLENLSFNFPPKGLEAEARALASKGRRFSAKLMILGQMALVGILSKLRLSLGRFDPIQYRSDVVKNSDFRKFDDGLKMTVDLDREGLRRIEERLEQAEREGICSYGLHRQNSALMTCIVASPLQRDHIHFVDGAAGGYAMAATSLKAKASA